MLNNTYIIVMSFTTMKMYSILLLKYELLNFQNMISLFRFIIWVPLFFFKIHLHFKIHYILHFCIVFSIKTVTKITITHVYKYNISDHLEGLYLHIFTAKGFWSFPHSLWFRLCKPFRKMVKNHKTYIKNMNISTLTNLLLMLLIDV